MYLVGFPLLLIPLAIYNIIAFLFNLGFKDTLFSVHMMSGAELAIFARLWCSASHSRV